MRILFAGDVNGNFEAVFKRLDKIEEANGPFAAVLCCGRFFGFDGKCPERRARIPIYFMDSRGASIALKDEVFPGIHYLGECGIKTVADQLTVAYCGPGQTESQVRKGIGLKADETGYLGADILLTSEWPRGIETHVDATWLEEYGLRPEAVGGRAEALAAVLAKPRYHIAGSHNIYWARVPYLLPESHEVRASKTVRFVALAQAAKSKEKMRKWLHAIELDAVPYASLDLLHAIPPGTTDSPYLEKKAPVFKEEDDLSHSKRKKNPEATTLFIGGLPPYLTEDRLRNALSAAIEANSATKPPVSVRLCTGSTKKGVYAFADFEDNDSASTALSALKCSGLDFDGRRPTFDWGHQSAVSTKRARYPEDTRSECWFCLASPCCETHLVVSVGDSAYLAMPKGPLIKEHALIVPVDHVAQARNNADIFLYLKALARCFKAEHKLTIAFERFAPSTKKGVYHAHIQVIPVEADLQALIDAFKKQATSFRFELESTTTTTTPSTSALEATSPFFRLFIYDGHSETPLITLMNYGDKIPLHFGRYVLAHFLNIPDKVHWKSCELSQQEELALCTRFKDTFAPFDPFAPKTSTSS